MYDVRAIGNWFLNRAEEGGDPLTAMKLQKLAYIAHGWYMGFGNPPLVHDAVEAWRWGPVFRSLYREFRDFGSEPITARAMVFDGGSLREREISIRDYEEPDADEMDEFLEGVWQVYGGFSAAQLSDITHRAGTPWYQMFLQMGEEIKPFVVIPNEMIRAHYEKLLDERATTANSPG